MNTEDLLKLRAAGLSYFKDRDIELHFRDLDKHYIAPQVVMDKPESITSGAAMGAPFEPIESKEIVHKVEEMSSLLKLDDKDLVDRLFPEGDAEESSQDD